MAWKRKYRCNQCGYEADVYEGRGLFRQQIMAMYCPDCKTVQNIVVGGIIADVARKWDMKTCPKCASRQVDHQMEYTGEKEFWT